MVHPSINFVLPPYSITQKKKWIFKQSAAPTLATLAGAANGLRLLAAHGLAGIKVTLLLKLDVDRAKNSLLGSHSKCSKILILNQN